MLRGASLLVARYAHFAHATKLREEACTATPACAAVPQAGIFRGSATVTDKQRAAEESTRRAAERQEQQTHPPFCTVARALAAMQPPHLSAGPHRTRAAGAQHRAHGWRPRPAARWCWALRGPARLRPPRGRHEPASLLVGHCGCFSHSDMSTSSRTLALACACAKACRPMFFIRSVPTRTLKALQGSPSARGTCQHTQGAPSGDARAKHATRDSCELSNTRQGASCCIFLRLTSASKRLATMSPACACVCC